MQSKHILREEQSTKQNKKKHKMSIDYAPTVILFFPCSLKSIRVGPKNLGSVGLPEPHIHFILA